MSIAAASVSEEPIGAFGEGSGGGRDTRTPTKRTVRALADRTDSPEAR